MAASPAPPTSERLCRRRPFIVTIGRGRRQGCAAPPILPRPAFRCAHQPRQNRYLHAPLARPLRGPVTPIPSDRPPALVSTNRRRAHAHSHHTHPGMARGSGSNTSRNRSTRDARTGTPGSAQARPQAQAALGRVTGRRGGAGRPATPVGATTDALNALAIIRSQVQQRRAFQASSPNTPGRPLGRPFFWAIARQSCRRGSLFLPKLKRFRAAKPPHSGRLGEAVERSR